MILNHIVTEEQNGKTVKIILKQQLKLSERLIKKLKYANKVLCNGIPVFVNAIVNTGDIVKVNIDFDEESEEIIPQEIELDITYEDDFLIVINKQPGIVVHPTSNHFSGTIANAIKHHWDQNGIQRKIRPVSRLDRDTSGLIIFAKNQFVQDFLIRQMQDETFIKEYMGVISCDIAKENGIIDLPISRKSDSIILRQVSPEGARAVTQFEVIEHLRDAALLKFRLKTGRTHQIRVHCQAIGHPLIGDTQYSHIKTELIGRQALHSHRVCFIHPSSRESFELIAPMPPDMKNLLYTLKL